MIIETATLHAGTSTKVGSTEEHSEHRNGYTPYRNMHKEPGDNLRSKFIK